jgi:predicted component of type VI protein secretion system
VDYTKMTDAELNTTSASLEAERNEISKKLAAVNEVRNMRAAEESLKRKLAQFSPEELAILAKKSQVAGVSGISSGEKFGHG